MHVQTRPEETSALARLMPGARLVEVSGCDVAADPARAWEHVRHGDLGGPRLIRALFGLRALPDHLLGRGRAPLRMRVDDLVPTAEAPGFSVMIDTPPREVVVGAVGQVWRPNIPFVHVEDAEAFAAFATPGYVRVAWALRIAPRTAGGARVEIEVRVDATDPASWRRFRRYFAVVGPGSRLVRRSLLRSIERDLGRPPLPGDDLLPDAGAEATHEVTVDAPPERIWPWLAQMGRGRAGFYSIDLLDNGGARSARELDPALADLKVGDVLPADARGNGFEVLDLDPGRALVLGGLYDAEAGRQLPFRDPRPGRFWQATWAFALEPLPRSRTRLIARGRAAYPPSGRLRVAWEKPVHAVMQRVQLRNLARRAEGRLPATDWRDALAGLGGAGIMAGAAATPFLRARRGAWAPGTGAGGRAVPGGRAHPRAALGLDARHRDRRARRGRVALGGADRRGPRRVLQLHVAREPGGLRRARRRADPPRVAGARRRSPGPPPVRPALRDRRGGAGPPPAGIRRLRIRRRGPPGGPGRRRAGFCSPRPSARGARGS